MRTFAHKQKPTQQTKSSNSARSGRTFSAQSREVRSILHLQRTIGNHAVQRLVQSNAEELHAESATPASTRFGHNFSRIPIFSPSPVQVQPKLTVSAPGDMYEQEADRVADQVMRMPKLLPQHGCPSDGGCLKCQVEQPAQVEVRLRTKATHARGAGQIAAPSIVREVLAAPGHPFDSSTRASMESRLGHDFSHVRIHTNPKAAESANEMNALAYTAGRNVVFGPGRYAPGTTEGDQLLAHELTHVVQQDGASSPSDVIQKKPKVSQRLGMRVVKHTDGSIEVTANRPWSEESGIGSTVIGMADVTPGITVEDLIKELVDCGGYKNEKHVREGFIQGTRIVVKEGKVLEISVRGKVYKAGGEQKPDFNFFLKEGARIFSKAGFGLSSGEAQGRDAGDGYDSRYWTEKGARGTIQALVPAWDAMDKMVENIGQDVPKAGGGKTRWRFDCFEATQILRLYAIWRTTTRSEFNRTYRPLRLGFHASTKTGLGETFYSDGPGKPAYKYVGGKRSGSLLIGARQVSLSKSIKDIAIDAPNGSFVSFGSKDIQTRCAASPGLSMCDFRFENTIKVGSDRYFAHPFGVVSSGTIFEKMAKAAGATPILDYYRKNIYVSTVRYPK